ncbi:NnrU family protein [Simplicispira suum]|uniref:Protein NrnU n=1 Tax=Simplicispira suum TaxID=2109915 RepID=A0A2S0MZ10_9BURK|nr:NnrU family protein [Simplicispira suum]AVO41138.1 protein NrnU [Simplicispira suum]MBW7834587.1 NnrU family protein [Simplicispira suum]
MSLLILGLVLFLGVHSVRIVADGWRTRMRGRLGEGGWKGLYSLASLVGLGLVIWGYGLARQDPMVLWVPPIAMRHAASLLTLVSFILLVAAYVPRNAFKARLHHPMVLAVKVWALAHLLSNGNLADVLLFGGFLLWAVLDFRAARQRDRVQGTRYASGTLAGTAIAVVLGLVAWAAFAFWGHALLIGVSPMGR